MIKQLAWNTFKNTGNIDTFMELVAVRNLENKLGENTNCSIGNIGNIDNNIENIDVNIVENNIQ